MYIIFSVKGLMWFLIEVIMLDYFFSFKSQFQAKNLEAKREFRAHKVKHTEKYKHLVPFHYAVKV